MKSKISFVCQQCGYESAKFLGRCPECGEWNSLKEFKIQNSESRIRSGRTSERKNTTPKKIDEIHYEEKGRIPTGFSEMDGVLGGGIVKGSVVLLAGDPGIGKSTLLLQIALQIARGPATTFPPASARSSLTGSNELRAGGSPSSRVTPRGSVLYISGEESEEQVKLRVKRISNNSNNLNLLVLSETDTDAVVEVIENTKPSLVVIDSIQAMESENLSGLSGSVGQIRYSASQFIKVAKSLNIPIIIIGHVTKEGMVAGPMVLSHMVDAVLLLEGEKLISLRILRSFKNRFGSVDEVGIFSMEEKGMTEVKDSSKVFLSKNANSSPGSVFVVALEGTRAFLVEIQALVVFSKLPMPRRVASGIDYKRLELLLAVLQKHCRVPLDTMDVFVNVAGGLKLSDPATDLGICLAIFSSFKNIPFSKTVGISEVGLLGELRGVPFLEKRIKEAKKLGFEKIITPNAFKRLIDVLNSTGKEVNVNGAKN